MSEEAKQQMAQEIGKQMAPEHPDTLYCPRCSEGDDKQPLTSVGDNREQFFCSHCGMEARIIVHSLPYGGEDIKLGPLPESSKKSPCEFGCKHYHPATDTVSHTCHSGKLPDSGCWPAPIYQTDPDTGEWVCGYEPIGKVTPQMIHSIFWRMLKDCGGVTMPGDFFKNVPVDQKFEGQYDETNDVWHFFVRTQRNRKKIITPSRKVIT